MADCITEAQAREWKDQVSAYARRLTEVIAERDAAREERENLRAEWGADISRACNERDAAREALAKVAAKLNCRGNSEVAHYCPNCDNSLSDVREIARAACEAQP